MQVQALTLNTRISPYKARQISRAIQGKTAILAQEMLKFIPRKAATLIMKTLNSAIANAENNHNLSSKNLIVHRALIEEGPAFRRFVPAPRGMAHPIKKRTSHIRIVLTDEK